MVLRLNSKTLPWKLLVPLLMTTDTMAPEPRPPSANDEAVVTRYSPTDSWGTATAGALGAPSNEASLAHRPSTLVLLELVRKPLTLPPPSGLVPACRKNRSIGLRPLRG